MKHLDKLKSSGVLQIEDRGEAAKKIRETIFGKYEGAARSRLALSRVMRLRDLQFQTPA
jgi:hypothetical protein